MILFKKILPYLVAFTLFTIVSILYFSPVLKGEKIVQGDIRQFIGMAKEINDFRAENEEEPFWTNSSFVGMPSFQLSTHYPYDFLKKIDAVLRFLPRPADYLFLYLFSFFLMLKSLKVENKLALFGALAFGFSTYLIIIIGVGHNAKAHAIAYMPLVLSGLIYLINGRLLQGFVITAVAMGLELNAGHPQMTYYLLFMILILALVWLIDAVKNKENTKDLFKKLALGLLGLLLALGMNASNLLATKQYAEFSTRSQSDLTILPDGSPKETITSGLDKGYITEYSYGISESLDLIYARFKGGSNAEPLDMSSNSYAFLRSKVGTSNARSFIESAPLYWGDQPIVSAPAYIGGSIVFLFILALFLVKGVWRNWLIASIVFSLLLSWGKNFSFLTDFFIDYVPFYDKFRAVSSIQVILELAIPFLAVLGLKQWFTGAESPETKIKSLKVSYYILGGLSLCLLFFSSELFTFSGGNDAYFESMIPGFSEALILDRKEVLFYDVLKTLILITVIFAVLWLQIKNKLKYSYTLLILAIVCTLDLIQVDRRYVNDSNFSRARNVDRPFEKSEIDQIILEDNSYFRVANLAGNMMNDGATSYFHHSLGGYHAAKPKRFQDLYDFYISQNHMEVYNLLNTKYFIIPDENKRTVQENPNRNGNVWFVSELLKKSSADDVIRSLGQINTKDQVLVEEGDIALREIGSLNFQRDSTDYIRLKDYSLNRMTYQYSKVNPGFAVFSEAFYKPGWQAYIDGEPVKHYRVDYLLRGMDLPSGSHDIIFEFKPKVIQTGSWIGLGSYAVLFLVIVLFLSKYMKNKSSA